MSLSELTRLSARETVALLRRRAVSPLELIDAALARIAATDGALNALPTLCPERARAQAKAIMARPAGGPDQPAWLAGLPIAVKDLNAVAGVRTTQGSPIFAEDVPTRSDIMVERLEANGAIPLAKSNTPEFGAGAQTFNAVFGVTRNPWNTALTTAGSSGGSAAALAAGQVWLATGSDLGGSLRTPASFCGVASLRPSPGRVAHGPRALPFGTLSVEGPMARDIPDVALFLDAMAGSDPEDPLSLENPPRPFLAAAEAARLPLRVAFSENLGITPVDRQVRAVCRAALERLAGEGVAVEEACPDLREAPETFQTLRAAGFVAGLGPYYDTHRHLLKPDIVWNIEKGLRLTPEQIAAAERARGALYARMVAFMKGYDLLICPAAAVLPFPVEIPWVRQIEGEIFDNYMDWLRIVSAITLTACPVATLPCGFSQEGLPVGLQLVGQPRGEAALLCQAAAVEQVFGLNRLLPIEPRRGR